MAQAQTRREATRTPAPNPVYTPSPPLKAFNMTVRLYRHVLVSSLAWCLVLLLTVAVTFAGKTGRSVPNESSCETLPSSIHIMKEDFGEDGKRMRTCEGDVAVSKCEGTCVSQMQPSVNSQYGFIKECRCCRETYLREREVVLRHCYDGDGQTLADKSGHMKIRLKEPAECRCFKCGDS